MTNPWETYSPSIRRPGRRRGWIRWGGALVAAMIVAVGLLLWTGRRIDPPRPPPEPDIPAPVSSLAGMVYPTTHDLLSETNRSQIFQPTASGRIESALWGSTRTGSDLRARFHAGVDIAPAHRHPSRRPTDPVNAIADGIVRHVSRAAGGSTYGIYVVVEHDDPVGPVYSWYAHLSSLKRGLAPGDVVAAGDMLGIMGNSASYTIPMSRAHLHLEITVMLNRRFGEWAREHGIRPDRGNYHGWNFRSIDPLDVYAARDAGEGFTVDGYLRKLPVAFELVLSVARPLDYFEHYPGLWAGPALPPSGGKLVLYCSEGGAPLKGRLARPKEAATLAAAGAPVVRFADPGVLGRNGLRMVTQRGNAWELGSGAQRWLSILTY